MDEVRGRTRQLQLGGRLGKPDTLNSFALYWTPRRLGMPSLVLAWDQIVSQQCTDLADWLRPVAASEASLWRLTGLPWFHRAGLRPALAGRTHPASHRPTIGGEAVMGSRTLSDIAPPVSSALHAKKQWSPLNWVNNHPIRERFQKTKLPSFWNNILFIRC